MDFPGDSGGKESICNVGDPGSVPELERSTGEGSGYPLRYSCVENSMDRGAWQAYSSWCHRESDTTEQLTHQGFIAITAFTLPNY